MQGVGVGAEGGWLALAGGRRAVMGDSWWLAKAISLAKLMMSLRAAGQPPHTPLTYRIFEGKKCQPNDNWSKTNSPRHDTPLAILIISVRET